MAKKIEAITIEAQDRKELGTREVKRLRREQWLPAIVYDSEGHSRPIKLKRHNFEMLMRHRGGQNVLIDLVVEGESPRKVLLKDLQRDRIRDMALHVDFLEISMTKKLRVQVAITLKGDPVGVTQQGGILEQMLRSVEVECLPVDIVDEIVMDVSGLELGKTLFVRDIPVDPKLTILTSPDIAIATVQLPKEEEEVKPAAEEGAPTEPALVGEEEKKEGEPAEEKKEGKEAPQAKEETKEKGEKGKGKEQK